MTIAATIPTIRYTGAGTATPLAVPFRFFANADLTVTQIVSGVETVLVLGSDYTITGANNPAGGSVIPVAPIDIGTIWKIERYTARTQQTDFVDGNNFPAEAHENGLDRLTAIDQEIDAGQQDIRSRAFLVPDGEIGGIVEPVDTRKSKVAIWDDLGLLASASYDAVAQSLSSILLNYLPSTFKGDPGSPGEGYSTRSALADAGDTATNLDDAFLTEGTRTGKFIFYTVAGFLTKTGKSLTAEVAKDPRQGIYVAAAGAASGANGAWVREYISVILVDWFDEVADTDQRAAVQAAIDIAIDGDEIKFTDGRIYRIEMTSETADSIVSTALGWTPNSPDYVGILIQQRRRLFFNFGGAVFTAPRGYVFFEFGCQDIDYSGGEIVFDDDPTDPGYASAVGLEPAGHHCIYSIGGQISAVRIKYARRAFHSLRAYKNIQDCIAEASGYKGFGHYAAISKFTGVTGNMAAVAAYIGCDEQQLYQSPTWERCQAIGFRGDGFYNAADIKTIECDAIDPIDPTTVGETLVKGFNNAGGIAVRIRCQALQREVPASVLTDGQGPGGADVYTQGFGHFAENVVDGIVDGVFEDCISDGFASGFVLSEVGKVEFRGKNIARKWTINGLQAVSRTGVSTIRHLDVGAFVLDQPHTGTQRGAPDNGLGAVGGIVITKHSGGGATQFVRIDNIKMDIDTSLVTHAGTRAAIQGGLLRCDQGDDENLLLGNIDIAAAEEALSTLYIRNASSVGSGLTTRMVRNCAGAKIINLKDVAATIDLTGLVQWSDCDIIIQSLAGASTTITLGHPLPASRRLRILNLSSGRVTVHSYQIEAEGEVGEPAIYCHLKNTAINQRTAAHLLAAHSYSATGRSNMVPISVTQIGGTVVFNSSAGG